MQQGKWMVAGFVAGLAVAGGASLLLRDDAAREQEQARVGELKAQVERLESAVTKPPATINGPRRLSGLRHHAISPLRM